MSKPRLRWDALDALSAIASPAWVVDVEQGRNVWANEAGLALWNAGSVEALRAGDHSGASAASRERLGALLEMVGNGRSVTDYWTVHPGGTPVTFEGRFDGISLPDGRLGLLVQARLTDEREFSAELRRRVESYRHAPSPISLHRPDGAAVIRNPSAIRFFGPLDEEAGHDDLAQQLGGAAAADEARRALAQDRQVRRRARLDTREGQRWFDVELQMLPDPVSGQQAVLFSAQDVTEAQTAQLRLAAENRVMEMISRGQPLGEVLDALVAEIEALNPGMLCTVLLLDDDGIHVRSVTAPRVPAPFGAALKGSAIGPKAGSCGTAMFRRRPVITFDIAADPLWEDYRDLALPYGLRACWSVPVVAASGEVVGSFAAYYSVPRMPHPEEMALLETGRHIAGIAIERDRAMQALRTRHERLQMVMDAMPFSIAYADRNLRYVAVNRRFEEFFNQRREQVIGRHTWDVIGKPLFDSIKPYMDQVMAGQEVKYERERLGEDGRARHFEVHYLPQIGDDGTVLGHFGILHDITERKRSEALLQFLANHDQLTRLPNRNQFSQKLQEALGRASRYGHRAALMFIDLDRFKNVNDTLGHESGDMLLVAVADRFRETLRATDTLARLGGDEFTVVLENIEGPAQAAASAQRLLGTFAQPFQVQGQELFLGASIGISLFPEDGQDATTLLRNADIAMYRSKDLGRNTFEFYSSEATAATLERLQLESSLRRALEREEFQLHFQPIVDLESGAIVGMESLVRWNHPERGMVAPATFIPMAEESGLIVPIGDWVLRAACQQARQLADLGHRGLRVAVNLSARQFRRQDLAQAIADTMAAARVTPDMIELEVTESSVMQDAEVAVRTLNSLKEMGVHLSIDDFGTGYSSLSQLKRFPIDALKVDQSFVRDIPNDENDAAIASAIIAMGHSLRLTLIAEGIETAEQLAFLRGLGCQRGQGFLFSRPLPAAELLHLLPGPAARIAPTAAARRPVH
ncbi:MAG TPA: EAL domain-containing protein [Burkholderiales bacterium]|nr:EAL domain-containing protein [Burkholderiales bacterium]